MGMTKTRAKKAEFAITANFFIQGILGLTQVPRIPEIIKQINVDFTTWGLVTGLAILGSLFGLWLTPRFLAKIGTKNGIMLGGIGQAIFLALIGTAHSAGEYLIYAIGASLFGSVLTITLNSQGVAIQKAMQKIILGRIHATWSVGATLSALLSGAMAVFLPMPVHFAIISGIYIVLQLWLGRSLLTKKEDGHGSANASAPKKSQFFKAPSQVWLLALGMFAGVFGEISMIDWSAIYARDVLAVDVATRAIPYAVFSGAMIVGRIMITRFTRNRHLSDLTRLSGIFGGIALLIGIFVGQAISQYDQTLALFVSSAFFAIAGLGSAPMVPSFFSAAGYVPGMNTAQVLARMSFISNVMFFGAKYLMGALTQNVGIALAYIFPVLTYFMAAILSGIVAKRAKADEALIGALPPTGMMTIIDE